MAAPRPTPRSSPPSLTSTARPVGGVLSVRDDGHRPGNTLPDPWTGATGQPVFPWRGRITSPLPPASPAARRHRTAAEPRSPQFFGTGGRRHFSGRRQHNQLFRPGRMELSAAVLHSMRRCARRRAVSMPSSSARNWSASRASARRSGVYPAVARLKALAAEVRAARPSGEDRLCGGLDRIWRACPGTVRRCAFRSIPCGATPTSTLSASTYYPPVADWRDGATISMQRLAGGATVAYLKDRSAAGEAFDWYYASDAARAAQLRTPITDGAYGKPWTFRAKDLAGWWSNSHMSAGWRRRDGGDRLVAGQADLADRDRLSGGRQGANAPNLFPDPKSTESGYPPFSSGHAR
jgi:hypothetical protein